MRSLSRAELLLCQALFSAGLALGDEPDPEAAVGREVFYSGKVQGVGFRATAVDLARGRPVTGWVKNLADGRVQLVVEGSASEVKKFLEAIRSYWGKNIEKEQVEERKPTGDFKSFTVR